MIVQFNNQMKLVCAELRKVRLNEGDLYLRSVNRKNVWFGSVSLIGSVFYEPESVRVLLQLITFT